MVNRSLSGKSNWQSTKAASRPKMPQTHAKRVKAIDKMTAVETETTVISDRTVATAKVETGTAKIAMVDVAAVAVVEVEMKVRKATIDTRVKTTNRSAMIRWKCLGTSICVTKATDSCVSTVTFRRATTRTCR